jgi:cadmium resistance protein CadD (predicted permease)
VLERWGRLIAPVVLVILGVYIVWRAGTIGAIAAACR